MKIGRVISSLCLLLAITLTIYSPTTVLAEEEPLTVTTTALAAGMVGEAYSETLEATGGTTPYTWSMSADNLPAGLSLNPTTGEISGTPTEMGTANFTVKVTDSATPAEETPKELSIRVNPEPTIEIAPSFPKLEGVAGSNFQFEVELTYTSGGLGGDASLFELVITTPEGWSAYMTPQFDRENRISAIRLAPSFSGTKIKLIVQSPFWPLPEPGDYTITLEAISADLQTSTELTAKITAKYLMVLAPSGESYNTKAKAGEDNFFSIEVGNLGSAAIENITFSSTKPSGWTIEFSPEKIESLPALDFQTVDINIKPPTETIAGDYRISVRASGNEASEEINFIRVTVETPTIWGWVGVGIIVLVVAGLAYVFMRFSRR